MRGDAENVERYGDRLQHMYTALGRYASAVTLTTPQDDDDTWEPEPDPSIPAQDAAGADGTALQRRVRALLDEQDAAGARRLLEERVALNPADWKALCLYGTVLSATGDPLGGREQLERALSAAPDELEPYFRIADAYAREGRLEQLVERFQKEVSDNPFLAGARVALALGLARGGQPDHAIQQGLEAVRLAPDDELAHVALAEGQMARAYSLLRSNWDGAWIVFQDCATTLFRLANSKWEESGQWSELAGKFFEDFAMKSHWLQPPLNFTGMASREVEILACATHFYRQAQEREPARATERAVTRVWETLSALASPEALSEAAEHLHQDGWRSEALMLLMLSLQADPDQAQAYARLAHLLYDETSEDSREVALDYIRRAIRLDPQNPAYLEAERYFQRQHPVLRGEKGEKGDDRER
jgi:tetratricopeptide (TPR) repeat protein